MADELATVKKAGLVERFGDKYGVEGNKVLNTLKQTCFSIKSGEVSNEQMMALLIVADQYGLNPFTKEIYAFPDKNNGVVPVVGVDGWARIINSDKHFDGMEFRQSETMITMGGGKPCPEWMECLMYRDDRTRPTIVREYLDEVYQPKRGNYSGPWQSHTKRFLRHKTMIQCARIGFGFVGIYDQDEAERIVDVTGQGSDTICTPAQKDIVYMDDEKFQKNLPAYTKMIESGNETASELMAFLSTKAELTPDQRDTLEAILPDVVTDAEVVT